MIVTTHSGKGKRLFKVGRKKTTGHFNYLFTFFSHTVNNTKDKDTDEENDDGCDDSGEEGDGGSSNSPGNERTNGSGSAHSRNQKRPIPNEQKDGKYYERRRRNNLAAKKSRDARKTREDQVRRLLLFNLFTSYLLLLLQAFSLNIGKNCMIKRYILIIMYTSRLSFHSMEKQIPAAAPVCCKSRGKVMIHQTFDQRNDYLFIVLHLVHLLPEETI